MYASPDIAPTLMEPLREGIAKRPDGKRFEDLEIVAHASLVVMDDVKAALDRLRPMMARAVGGGGGGDGREGAQLS